MPTYTQDEVDEMMRKRDIEEAGRAVASGRLVMMPPISDEQQGLTKHSEFDVSVHNSPSGKRRRKFTGQPRRHCSECTFPEGCMMCTLP
jgi:hypothetical protein